jgi:hypothetical protein
MLRSARGGAEAVARSVAWVDGDTASGGDRSELWNR